MANKERGLFRMIFKAFVASIKPSPAGRLMGEDYNGTKYYERQQRQDGSHKKSHRYFTPSTKEKFDQDVPAEWEAWLRHRRKEPPTVQEVNKNYELMRTKKLNAAKLDQVYSQHKREKSENGFKDEKMVGSFPTYEEYLNEGQNVKKKDNS